MPVVVSDLREQLQGQLSAKRTSLTETEDQVRRYVGERALLSTRGGRGGARGGRGGVREGGRLSLGSTGSSGAQDQRRKSDDDRRRSLSDRLGEPLNRDQDEEDALNRNVQSRVIKEVKSRSEALSEQVVDKKVDARNKRLFGSLLGTLQRFSADEKKKKEVTEKKKEVEKKIDEKTEREKEELKTKRRELLDEQKQKKQDIRVLQIKVKRVEEFEAWESVKKQEKCFIRTDKGIHKVYWLPKNHSSKTHTLLQDTRDIIDKEILERKEIFETELREIEERMRQRRSFGDVKEEGDDGEKDKNDDENGHAAAADADEEEEGDSAFMADRKIVVRDEKDAENGSSKNGGGNGELNGVKVEKEKELEPEKEKRGARDEEKGEKEKKGTRDEEKGAREERKRRDRSPHQDESSEKKKRRSGEIQVKKEKDTKDKDSKDKDSKDKDSKSKVSKYKDEKVVKKRSKRDESSSSSDLDESDTSSSSSEEDKKSKKKSSKPAGDKRKSAGSRDAKKKRRKDSSSSESSSDSD